MARAEVVYDTNVLVSAVVGLIRGRDTPPVRCFRAVLEGSVQLHTSPPILHEIRDVLMRPKIGLDRSVATEYADLVARVGRGVRVTGCVSVLQRDPDDNIFLECAERARAEFLVTGNRKHYEELGATDSGVLVYGVTRIMAPAEFCATLGL